MEITCPIVCHADLLDTLLSRLCTTPGGRCPSCLTVALSRWLLASIAACGGCMHRALRGLWGVVAQGPMHITTTQKGLSVWLPANVNGHKLSLVVTREEFQHTGVEDAIVKLIQVGAWKDNINSLSNSKGLPQCRRPVAWMRRAMEQRSPLLRDFIKGEMISLMGEVEREMAMGGDVGKWLVVSGWGEGVVKEKELKC